MATTYLVELEGDALAYFLHRSRAEEYASLLPGSTIAEFEISDDVVELRDCIFCGKTHVSIFGCSCGNGW